MFETTPTTLFGQLAWFYLNEPNQTVLDTLVTTFPELRLREGDLALIRQDYHNLFTVPVSGSYLPPYESAWRTNRLWGPITHHVADYYLASGFNLATLQTAPIWQMQIIPDHIGYELAFYGELLENQLQASHRFYTEHVKTWMLSYAVQVEEKATTPVYQLVGELTADAIRDTNL